MSRKLPRAGSFEDSPMAYSDPAAPIFSGLLSLLLLRAESRESSERLEGFLPRRKRAL